MEQNPGATSKAILIIVMAGGLVLLGLGKLENLANAGAYALIFIGSLLNRLDSRHCDYKATFTAGGVTATVEAGSAMGAFPSLRSSGPDDEPGAPSGAPNA